MEMVGGAAGMLGRARGSRLRGRAPQQAAVDHGRALRRRGLALPRPFARGLQRAHLARARSRCRVGGVARMASNAREQFLTGPIFDWTNFRLDMGSANLPAWAHVRDRPLRLPPAAPATRPRLLQPLRVSPLGRVSSHCFPLLLTMKRVLFWLCNQPLWAPSR